MSKRSSIDVKFPCSSARSVEVAELGAGVERLAEGRPGGALAACRRLFGAGNRARKSRARLVSAAVGFRREKPQISGLDRGSSSSPAELADVRRRPRPGG